VVLGSTSKTTTELIACSYGVLPLFLQAYSLAGMGCGAGVIGIHLVRDILQAHPGANALFICAGACAMVYVFDVFDDYVNAFVKPSRFVEAAVRWQSGQVCPAVYTLSLTMADACCTPHCIDTVPFIIMLTLRCLQWLLPCHLLHILCCDQHVVSRIAYSRLQRSAAQPSIGAATSTAWCPMRCSAWEAAQLC
jgi:hypothetical protein